LSCGNEAKDTVTARQKGKAIFSGRSYPTSMEHTLQFFFAKGELNPENVALRYRKRLNDHLKKPLSAVFMKQYLTFNAADFAQDEEFLKWVKYPECYPLLRERWLKFMRENPQKREEIEEARLMILAVVKEKQFIPDERTHREVWNRVQESIGEMEDAPERVMLWQRWYSKAAVVLMILGVGWFLLRLPESAPQLADAQMEEAVPLEKYINNAALPKTIVLSDGTSIVLQPYSVLEYPQTFKSDVREVYLTGEGFFEVKRDVNRPFMVHAHDIVTRVLGTSFTVRNYEGEKNVLVQVKTGKVSVFKEKKKFTEDGNVEGVVLMPNQQVVYERDEMKMTKSLVENPSVLIPLVKQEFEFTDTPVREVFRIIEEAYGVDIVYDEEVLANCYLNASLDDVPLYDKLKLICKGINTTYEIIDSHIIIYGKGCGDPVTDTN
jgi:transmembrane sensor